jgi:O-antigen/teichoic acid export membrane protein
MGVSLYTVRVVLNVLGAEDYGIYNVVAGVVTMFSFLSGSLSSASQRFLSFELSGKENNRYTEIFTTMIFIYLFFGIVIFILLESVGLWLINNKLIIPIERIETSRKVFHLSIVSFFFTMFVSPYTASIVAHEDMTVYALFSVIETFLRLFLAILVQFINADKLFLYALLMLFVTIINSSMYILFAHFKYKSCRIVRYWNKNLFNELLSFLGWNLIGSFVSVLKNYGINIILNMFYGPIINASRAIAYQIKSASSSFAMNITTAIRPQITINYANSNNNKMYNLAFLSAKYSFYLVLLISLPIIFLINPILTL